ncbi:MAG TPA: SRPBCC family protein [Bacteroidia bacterium]|nr:SRPBCC family protein [Bacteroidia bacterium]
MTTIYLSTIIRAPVGKCFDLARDIDAHQKTTTHTNEIAVGGKTSGLCQQGDEITWEAKHFGISQRLTVRITRMDRPVFFEDIMVKGAFKSMKHEHQFEEKNGETIMRDIFQYDVPFGIAGKLFNALILKNYMTKFLRQRNAAMKDMLEKNHP